ncbi:MAG: arginine repressor [Arthrobacter sp.]|jgi:transcriptional regulator of arginine metabolism|nr:arginine repressor [Arthrobacter sp.]
MSELAAGRGALPGTRVPGNAPSTKIARQARIRALVTLRAVRSQAELAGLLSAEGIQVTQGTLSRDLLDLGATRVRAADGTHVYALRSEDEDSPRAAGLESGAEVLDARLTRLCAELLVAAESSANLVVLHTPPGAANFLAQSIDHSLLPDILGTIAGDDTVVVITRRPDGGADVAARFLEWADGV